MFHRASRPPPSLLHAVHLVWQGTTHICRIRTDDFFRNKPPPVGIGCSCACCGCPTVVVLQSCSLTHLFEQHGTQGSSAQYFYFPLSVPSLSECGCGVPVKRGAGPLTNSDFPLKRAECGKSQGTSAEVPSGFPFWCQTPYQGWLIQYVP